MKEPLLTALLISLGGALGTVLRYLLTQLAQRLYGSSMLGTLFINILGSLGLGVLLGLEINHQALISFFELGIFGGFTTFSMFILELVQRKSANLWITFSYITFSIVFSMLAVVLGMHIGGQLLGGGL